MILREASSKKSAGRTVWMLLIKAPAASWRPRTIPEGQTSSSPPLSDDSEFSVMPLFPGDAKNEGKEQPLQVASGCPESMRDMALKTPRLPSNDHVNQRTERRQPGESPHVPVGLLPLPSPQATVF